MENPKKRLSRIKTIIFDAGGVLFKVDWEKIKKDIMKKYGFSIFLYSDYPKNIAKYYKNKLSTGKISFKQTIKNITGLKNLSQFAKDYEKVYLKYRTLNRQMLALIKKLKKNYDILCLTNTNDIHFKANKSSRLFKDFDKVYASCSIGIKKPDKQAFKIILKESPLSPQESLFIDDNAKNIKSAKSIGINSILFKNYWDLKESLKRFNIQL